MRFLSLPAAAALIALAAAPGNAALPDPAADCTAFTTVQAVDGQASEARQTAKQYRSRGGSEAQFRRLLFNIELRGPDLSSAIAEGEKALALDASLPNIRGGLMGLYYLVGLDERAPQDSPSAVRLASPFYHGDTKALEAQIRNSEARLWDLPDGGFGFFHLAAVHDWQPLSRLYDQRPIAPQQLCFHNLKAAQTLVPALRAIGRPRDAETVLNCLRNRLAIEAQEKSRSWYAYAGDFEYDQASLAALTGNRNAALRWLDRAVARGWLGRPYSPKLSDRVQFDALRSSPQLAALQAKIDRTIAKERAQVLATPLRRAAKG